MMKTKELRGKTEAELKRRLSQLREEFRDLNFKLEQKQVKNHKRRGEVKKDISRILTILREEAIKQQDEKGK